MQDWLSARARATPTAVALLIGDKQWTYAELDHLVTAVAGHLFLFGVQAGDRVALFLPNNLLYVCLIHALARIGAILVPLNTRLTAAELGQQIAQVRCSFLVYGGDLPISPHESAGEGLTFISESQLDFTETLAVELPGSSFNPDALQAIVFTSGTTGRAKGAMLTFANHQAGATASAWRLGVLPEDRWLCCLPLYHVGGLAIILRSCLYGTAVVLHERFDTQTISHSLDTQRITLISLVPTMLTRLLDLRGAQAWPGTLRHVLVGGAPAGPELIERCLALDIPITTTYGLTEAASQVATMITAGVRRKPGSVGRPLLFNDVSIVDKNGRALPPGHEGEIVVSGPIVMAGYDGDDAATAAALRDGRLFTGDIGTLDDDGDLWVLQRRSDIVISGGENVYPAEIEAVLSRHPAVTAVCVVGVPDHEWGRRVVAAIVLNRPVDTGELESICRAELAGYKMPRRFFRLEKLPLTASGKIARREVEARLAALIERESSETR
jgi:O-succinylbenzoic acid--CoA ligase